MKIDTFRSVNKLSQGGLYILQIIFIVLSDLGVTELWKDVSVFKGFLLED